jgi:hypothetical protein
VSSVASRRGIQTLYKGVLFRSRTEARWAAYFDGVEWRWSYEPFDLYGYIPDFLLHFPAGEMVCEVKALDEDFRAAEIKLDCSTWEGPALIVAQNIEGKLCGRIRDWGTGMPEWCDAEFFTCISCGSVSVLAVEGDWSCRVCGAGNGNAHVGEYDPAPVWAEATNRVQWRAE